MKIPELEELRNRIGYVPAVLVVGEDAGIREGVVALMKEALKEAGSFRVEVIRLDADPERRPDPWQTLEEVATQPPMFGDAFVLVFENCPPSKATSQLKSFLASPAPHVRCILFTERKAERSGLAKLIEEAGGAVVQAKELRDAGAVQLAIATARGAGLKISPAVASALVDLTGTDRGAIANAVEALLRYLGKGSEVREEDLLGLVQRSRRDPPWALDEAIFQRDLATAIKIVSRNLQDDPASSLALFHKVLRLVRQVAMAQDLIAKGASDEEAQKELEIPWAFQWERLKKATQRFSREEVLAFLREAPQYEILAKRSVAGDEPILVALLTRLMARGASFQKAPRHDLT